MKNKDINCAVVEIKGRYPENGWALNEKCAELVYVLKGKGLVVIKNDTLELGNNANVGDMFLIEHGEKYYWGGNLTLIVSSSPAWYPEQHKIMG